jgi:hypothetical protein
VTVNPDWRGSGTNGVMHLDGQTLRRVDGGREFSGEGGGVLAASPDGRRYALGVGTPRKKCFIHVVIDAHVAVVADLADRSPARYVPADLAAFEALPWDTRPDSAAWPLLDLLRARLEHRFGHDVGISAVAGPPPGEDDIGLSAS